MKFLTWIAFAGIAAAQTAFDVASVKPTGHGAVVTVNRRSSHTSLDYGHGRFHAENASLVALVEYAYRVRDYQVIAPDWMKSDEASFDVDAKTAPDTTFGQALLLVQNMLAERFKLALHRESRTLPIYNLMAGGKISANLKPAALEGQSGIGSRNGHMTVKNTSMEDFAAYLTQVAGRPVFDKTGLSGSFDFTLDYTPQDDNPELPSIFTAVREQLGLKLEPAKGPAEVLVIDHAERVPSEN